MQATAAPAVARRRPVVGEVVRLAPGQAGGSVLAVGEVGTLLADDHSDRPFKVAGPRGTNCWFTEGEIEFVGTTSRLVVGSRVRLAPNEAARVDLAKSEVAVIVKDDGSDIPYQVGGKANADDSRAP